MIKYNTSNDKVCKLITKWCRENNFKYTFDTKDKDRALYTYPFVIDAPTDLKENLLENLNVK